MMTRLEQSIEVNAPAHTVYNQLTQFEDYPRFMEDIEEVKQIDDTHLHWRAKMNSHDTEWDAEIMEQVPDQCIVWRNMGGPIQMEKVEVQPLGDNKTRIRMSIEYEEPRQEHGQQDDVEAKIVQHAVHDLVRLKRFIESRRQETGEWRGEVHQGRVVGKEGGEAQTQPPPSSAQGSEGMNPEQAMSSPKEQEQASMQPPASLSQGQDDTAELRVSEEQSFDQQNAQARRVGQMPEEAARAIQSAADPQQARPADQQQGGPPG